MAHYQPLKDLSTPYQRPVQQCPRPEKEDQNYERSENTINKTSKPHQKIIEKNTNITRESPKPSCPVARNTFDKPGTGPITGFPSGTEIRKIFVILPSIYLIGYDSNYIEISNPSNLTI